MRAKDAVGGYGERVAARFLQAGGLRVLDRNWRCPAGEIDIVAQDGDVVVFCEVKTRRSLDYGLPVDAVTPAKVRRLRVLAMQWLGAHEQPFRPVRFDVISVVPQRHGAAAVEHHRGAF